MAANFEPTLFTQAVSKILNSWAALQIAVDQGIGGPDSREKAEWMVTAICTWFSENKDIRPDELVEFLEDVLGDVFEQLVIEDGSTQMVARHICQSYNLISGGRATEVLGILQRLPSVNVAQQSRQSEAAEDEVEMPDDNSAGEGEPLSSTPVSHPALSNGTVDSSHNGDTGGEGDDGLSKMDVEEEEGWKVIQRGKKKK